MPVGCLLFEGYASERRELTHSRVESASLGFGLERTTRCPRAFIPVFLHLRPALPLLSSRMGAGFVMSLHLRDGLGAVPSVPSHLVAVSPPLEWRQSPSHQPPHVQVPWLTISFIFARLADAPRSYTPVKLVGDGSFGTVWLCDWHSPLPAGTTLSPMQCGAGARPEWVGKRLVAVKRMKRVWERGWEEAGKLKELEVSATLPTSPYSSRYTQRV